MPAITIDELQTKLQALYAEEDYQAALEFAAEYMDQFHEHRHLLFYWRSTMSARLGDYESAISLLKEALDSGTWYGETLLRHSPSYKDLQGKRDFEAIVSQNRSLQEIEHKKILPLLTIRPEANCLAGTPPCPLLIGLHSNMSTAQDSIEFWRAAASEGWLVAVPQSSQAVWNGAYVWNNLEVSVWEIERHYQSIAEQYNIDEERTTIAGHSMGGEIAIWFALSGKIPNQGFIAYGPGGPFMEDLDKWNPLIANAQGKGIRGYILMGDEDNTIPRDNILKFIDILNEHEISCEYESVPHAGHDFVNHYEAGLIRALRFLNL